MQADLKSRICKPYFFGKEAGFISEKTLTAVSDESKVYIAAYDPESLQTANRYSAPSPTSNLTESTLASILQNPQDWNNFKQLISICAYQINHDNILNAAIKNILIPFSHSKWKLVGSNERTRKIFTKWLDENHFEDILSGLAYDYWCYGQSVMYMYKDGAISILPIFRCQVTDISISGEPYIGFEVDKVKRRSEVNIDKELNKYKGYPKEILDGIQRGDSYAPLDYNNTFYIGGAKAYYEKYAMPICVAALPWLIKKEKLSTTEDIEFDNMSKSILQVKVGDKDFRPIPNKAEFNAVGKAYTSAVKNREQNLAIVAWNVDGKWISCSNKEVLESVTKSMSSINWNILASLSLSPVLALGSEHFEKSGSGSFSQTQAAVGVVNKRINTFLDNVAATINRMMYKLAESNGMSTKSLPEIVFEKVDLSFDENAKAEIIALYDKGLVSKHTLFENYPLDYEQEREHRESELKNGDDDIFSPPAQSYNMTSNDGAGAPEKNINERTSDPDNAKRSNEAPKPSTT